MKHEIKKTFECDYGHRVHNQSLNTDYSLDGCLACRHLHGHRMSVDVWLGADGLDGNMVTDFKHLNWMKQFIDDYLDHKFIIDINDPLFFQITNHMPLEVARHENGLGYIPLVVDDPVGNELRESFVIVDFVPTSEELSRYLFDVATKKMEPLYVKVLKVVFRETPKSEAVYNGV